MRKIHMMICLLGLLMACSSPVERVYNKETVMKDLKEIKNSIESSDYELLVNEINNDTKNEGELENKTYLQILDLVKSRKRLAIEQPLQLSNATDMGFEGFSFKLLGNEKKSIGYRLKGSFINISDKTFVKVEFVDSEDFFWADAKRNPYIEIILNNPIRLASVDFGERFDNWAKMENIVLPSASFENPWRPNEIKSFEMYFQPDVTCGYYIGVDDYGECLQPVHFNYEPNSCLLKIPIYVEDANGYKKQMFLSFDIMNDFKDFAMNKPQETTEDIYNNSQKQSNEIKREISPDKLIEKLSQTKNLLMPLPTDIQTLKKSIGEYSQFEPVDPDDPSPWGGEYIWNFTNGFILIALTSNLEQAPKENDEITLYSLKSKAKEQIFVPSYKLTLNKSTVNDCKKMFGNSLMTLQPNYLKINNNDFRSYFYFSEDGSLEQITQVKADIENID